MTTGTQHRNVDNGHYLVKAPLHEVGKQPHARCLPTSTKFVFGAFGLGMGVAYQRHKNRVLSC